MRWAIALVGVAACDGASPSRGLDAMLQIPGAQYRPGPFPDDDGGPNALLAKLDHASVVLGQTGEGLDATLDVGARTAIIGLAGVDGAWIVPAGIPDLETPDAPSVHTSIALSEDVVPGPFTLLVAAGGADGKVGAPTLVTAAATLAAPPAGLLVIRLEWMGRADLDLHVVDALGGEAWSDDPNTYEPPPPGTPIDPNNPLYLKGGILDHDGNGDCVREGTPNENVIWTMPPPAGEYVVRVDARSMCGDPIADWSVTAHANVTADDPGELLGAAIGLATQADADVRLPHGKGAGILALRFTRP